MPTGKSELNISIADEIFRSPDKKCKQRTDTRAMQRVVCLVRSLETNDVTDKNATYESIKTIGNLRTQTKSLPSSREILSLANQRRAYSVAEKSQRSMLSKSSESLELTTSWSIDQITELLNYKDKLLHARYVSKVSHVALDDRRRLNARPLIDTDPIELYFLVPSH